MTCETCHQNILSPFHKTACLPTPQEATEDWQRRMTEAVKAIQEKNKIRTNSDIALKNDGAKMPLDLLAWLDDAAMVMVGRVLQFGAIKYFRDNWRKGFKWSRLCAAAIRHIFAFLRGQDLDICEEHKGVRPDTCTECSGLPHLAHAICMLMFALSHYLTKSGTDDRHRDKVEQRDPNTTGAMR